MNVYSESGNGQTDSAYAAGCVDSLSAILYTEEMYGRPSRVRKRPVMTV
jgi:hypothetical protein